MQLRHLILAVGLALAGNAVPAYAHHGWAWTQSGFFRIEGTITDIYIGNPHPVIQVDVEGKVWRVELAPPAASAAAGFTDGVAKAGDTIVAIGNRSRDEGELRMKAVRIVVGGKTYDVYPSRAQRI
jgi:hypothetical protein